MYQLKLQQFNQLISLKILVKLMLHISFYIHYWIKWSDDHI